VVRKTVPWFHAKMPEAYFRQVSPSRQDAHLRAIVALQAQGIKVPEVQLRDTEGKGFTFISSEKSGNLYNQTVLRQLESLDPELGLRRVLLFQSSDTSLGLNVFDTFGEGDTEGARLFGAPGASASVLEAEATALATIKEYSERLLSDNAFSDSESLRLSSALLASHGKEETDVDASQIMNDFLARCPSTYVISHTSTPEVLHEQMQLFRTVAGGDDMAVRFSKYEGSAQHREDQMRLVFAIPQAPARAALHRCILLLNHHNIQLDRAQVDTIRDGDGDDYVTLLRMVVRPLNGPLPDAGNALVQDASRLTWLSDWSFNLASHSNGVFSLKEAEVALALSDVSRSLLDHPLLTRQHVRDRLYSPCVLPIASQLSKLFLARFDPEAVSSEAEYTEGLDSCLKQISGAVTDEPTKELLRLMTSAAKHTLRTNVHVEGRWAISLRLDPRYFESALPINSAGFDNVPYGTFFVAGRHFNGYHNRFRDIARGGLRVVLPPSSEAHSTESRRHFMECYGLAWAQQLKNKDIPEGGSKAVCLVTPVAGEDRGALMHACVKRMVDAMLDLIVPSTKKRIVTRTLNEDTAPIGDELIFLGPDENITSTDLDWIVQRAKKRGYVMPSAFMSSKPRAGINHKEYGVTSEGVAVFLREALRAIGIQPNDEQWTIKLTGGPDGDVAGNMIKILHRDYGSNVKIVGLADGTASAEDPDGLPVDELLRLFHDALPLSALTASKLGSKGVLVLTDTPEGVAARNTMHNRVVADAFVPAGGRPETMNASNWQDFLLPDGTPSARVIVEGANLFLTPEARLSLFETTGLPIVKDSSANKCGVICSSMEIRASMCVDDDEFVAMKAQYVEEVLSRLREMADLEATLLFAEASRNRTTPLPALSERISFAILRVADALATLMDSYAKKNDIWPIVSPQLPPTLAKSSHAPMLPKLLPSEYQKSVICKSLASRLVYREGLTFVETVPNERLPGFALSYLEQEQRVLSLADEVASSGYPFAAEVEKLLLKGGVRVAAEKAAAATRGTPN